MISVSDVSWGSGDESLVRMSSSKNGRRGSYSSECGDLFPFDLFLFQNNPVRWAIIPIL